MEAGCGNGITGMAGGCGCAGRMHGAFGGGVGCDKWIERATKGYVERRAGGDAEAWRGDSTEAEGCHGLTAG